MAQGSHTMASADESLNDDTSMNTQMPFGTQVQHPMRPRRTDEDIEFVGINRMEPVLAGNTQRAELKPRPGSTATVNAAADMQVQRIKLLSLLKPNLPPAVPQIQVRPDTTRLEDQVAASSPRRTETPSKRANRERVEELIARASHTPSRSDTGKKHPRGVEDGVSSTHHPSKKALISETDFPQSHISDMRAAADCSWMKGLIFNRESSIVPPDQVNILSKPESWHKSAAGQRFPEANLPMKDFMVLSRLVDERVAAEAVLEASSGSYNETDSSPASRPPTSVPQPENEQDNESEDESSTSSLSWSPSPSPEPPQRPDLTHQDLPPDSSNEIPENVTLSTTSQRPAAANEQSSRPILSHSSNELGGVEPPSSPPGAQAVVVSDDEMELEMSVPQALGEDLEMTSTSRPLSSNVPQTGPRARSVVQVKETPNLKAKHGQPVVTVSPPTQESHEQHDNSSSASIVQGTYYDFNSSAVEETHLGTLHKNNSKVVLDNTGRDLPAQLVGVQDSPKEDIQGVAMFDRFVHDNPQPEPARQIGREQETFRKQAPLNQEEAPAQPEPTPMSAQLPLKDSSSGEQAVPGPTESTSAVPVQPARKGSKQPSTTPSLTKRKRELTPTREKKRHKKSRPRKVATFSGRDAETVRRELNETMAQRSENERRKSSTSVETRHGSVSNVAVQQDADTKMVVVDAREAIEPQISEAVADFEREMSPRHQSLYAAPSPISRPSVGPSAAASVTENIDVVQMVQDVCKDNDDDQSVLEDPLQTQTVHVQPEPHVEQNAAPQLLAQPNATQPGPEVPSGTDRASPAAKMDTTLPSNIFEAFKSTYPEYTGNVKHFKNQCSQIEELDRDDRMVPKWMWDDYIVRSRTDYKDYTDECIDSGEAPMAYIRFYKDRIRDTVHKKCVIDTRDTLLKALEELGVQPRSVETLGPPPVSQQAVRQSSHQSSRSPVLDARGRKVPKLLTQPPQHPSRQTKQQTPRTSAYQPARSANSPRVQSDLTPTKKKSSRKSLPFPVPANSMPSPSSSTPRARHSLPTNTSRAAPSSSTRPPASTRRKSTLKFIESLQAAAESNPPPKSDNDEFRRFAKAQDRLTSVTGSTRVSSHSTAARIPSDRQSRGQELS